MLFEQHRLRLLPPQESFRELRQAIATEIRDKPFQRILPPELHGLSFPGEFRPWWIFGCKQGYCNLRLLT